MNLTSIKKRAYTLQRVYIARETDLTLGRWILPVSWKIANVIWCNIKRDLREGSLPVYRMNITYYNTKTSGSKAVISVYTEQRHAEQVREGLRDLGIGFPINWEILHDGAIIRHRSS